MGSRAFTSFHGSDVDAEQLSGIMVDYLALERARIYRRLFVTRFGILALVAAILGVVHWLTPVASSVSIGVFLVPPLWAWVVELQRDRRLGRRLEDVPNAVTHTVPYRAVEPLVEKGVKSS